MRIWAPSWKFVIITALIGANIVFIRIIEALYHNLEIRDTELSRIKKEICVNSVKSRGCPLCPYNWLLHGDDCYYYSEDVRDRTWDQSRDQCEMMGADLLIIKYQEQQEFIQRNLRLRRGDSYWIGLHRDGDGWRWVDGEHYNSSLIQIKTQSSGRCVVMTRSGYYQEDCSTNHSLICLKKAVRI